MSAVATTTVRDRFSAEAENWDALYTGTASTSIYEHNLLKRRETALRFVGQAMGRVLDVGCGPGNVTLKLPETAEIYATDFARPMLEVAQTSAAESGRSLDLTMSDATSIPFADDAFGSVLALGLMEYIADPTDVLSEMARVIQPGGTLVLSIPNRRSAFIFIDDVLKSIKNILTQILMPHPLRRAIKSLLGKPDAAYFTHKRHRFNPDTVVGQLNDLGFEIEAHRYHTFGFGLLNRVRLNLWLCRKFESYAGTHPNLEQLGWTIVLKAKKLS